MSQVLLPIQSLITTLGTVAFLVESDSDLAWRTIKQMIVSPVYCHSSLQVSLPSKHPDSPPLLPDTSFSCAYPVGASPTAPRHHFATELSPSRTCHRVSHPRLLHLLCHANCVSKAPSAPRGYLFGDARSLGAKESGESTFVLEPSTRVVCTRHRLTQHVHHSGGVAVTKQAHRQVSIPSVHVCTPTLTRNSVMGMSLKPNGNL